MKRFGFDGDDNTLTSQEARSCVFSPLTPLSSPRSRLSGCLFPAHVREKTDYYFDEETTFSLRVARSNVFSSCYSFVLKVRFRGAKTNYYRKVRGAILAEVNLL